MNTRNPSHLSIWRNGVASLILGVHIFTSCGDVWKYYSFGEVAFQFRYIPDAKKITISVTNPAMERLNTQFNDPRVEQTIVSDNDVRFIRGYDNSGRLIMEKSTQLVQSSVN